jgi:hypothetical protein
MFAEINNNKYYQLMVLLAAEFPDTEQINKANELLREIDLNILFQCACEHEMESIVFPALRSLYRGELSEAWEKKYIQTRNRISFMIDKLGEIAERLNEKGIPLVALKNGGIASAMIDDMAKSPMGDIDTLVNKKDFEKAHKILLEMGFKFEFRSEYEMEDLQQAFIDGGTEYYYQEASGSGNEMWFEMAWRPIAGRWIRLDKEPNAEILIEESHLVKDTSIRILAPEDNLLQVAIHTAKHSYVREPGFRLHLDVERIVKHSKIDWEIFNQKVTKVGTKTAVYYSLYIAKKLFKTPIPEACLQELKPNKIKNWYITTALKKAQLLHPTSRKFTRIQFVVFQFMLYDNLWDIYKVIIPYTKWLKEKYNFKIPVFIPWFMFIRILDLIGIRKSKSK